MYHIVKRLIVGWDWKTPAGHEDQPIVEWWVEQVAVEIVFQIGRRSHKRGDAQTFWRMDALLKAGANAEITAALR